MLRYAIHVLPQISVDCWLNLTVLFSIFSLFKWSFRQVRKASVELNTWERRAMFLAESASVTFPLWLTLLLRTPGTVHQANLIPLWSWYQGFLLGNDEIRWQIYFNVLLFVPFGCLLYLSKPRSLNKILLRGFLLSLIIELCQLVFKLGLFEWDDLLHNSLGCLLGGFAAKVLERVWNIHRLHKTSGRK